MVILHEIMKLLHYADAKDVKFFRIGTSGGLGMHAICTVFGPEICSISYCSSRTFGKYS